MNKLTNFKKNSIEIYTKAIIREFGRSYAHKAILLKSNDIDYTVYKRQITDSTPLEKQPVIRVKDILL